MTDNEIKKALECCIDTIGVDCDKCPYSDNCVTDENTSFIMTDALDLINRLQAENENARKLLEQCEDSGEYWESKYKTLEAENEELKKAKYIFSTVDYCADDLEKALKENEELKSAINGFRGYEDKIKAEAYKEFAKLLMSYYAQFDEVNEIITISNLEKAVKDCLKELVGGADV